jgi:hypothetical protein
MCHWNGFMAAAPGATPALGQSDRDGGEPYTEPFHHGGIHTITSFCPNPLLYHLRGHDDLFTSGPCGREPNVGTNHLYHLLCSGLGGLRPSEQGVVGSWW